MSASSPSNLKKISQFLGNLEKWVLVLLLGFLTAFALAQIISRNFLSVGLVWGDDLLRHGVLWISFLGAARATLERKHIRIDLLPRVLPVRLSFIADFMCCLISFVVCLLLLWASWNFVQGERLAGDIAFASIPYWWLELIFPISFALMACRFCLNCISGLVRGPEGVER
ncbi:MAG: TRAP transporter small permease [Deltaproteobacteria bacterium]|nr:TRAP transporter small permease [Deltaproteobacteria bacterium]PNV87247.1 MAG: TRAP transporter small permease [Desulfobacteraceae bacterium]MDH3772703.1 TRAP transporter small permease [Deltaproteobacteria bacterium]MDH3800619.1 TRAP transporter small permease [Deltaproteobacteria bacterium]MDH3849446.1 TRAP transporter small permease [Deltaproteobacteria bacterium]